MKKREMAVGIARGVEITAVGCPFFNRCPMAIEGTCDTQVPPIREPIKGHTIACHVTIDDLVEADRHAQQILHGFEKVGEEDDRMFTAH
jgi:peptide/nickel transport system ATP-binding protein